MKNCLIFALILFSFTFSRSQMITSISPDSGMIGETLQVTVTGTQTHFTSGSSTWCWLESPTINALPWSTFAINDSVLVAKFAFDCNDMAKTYHVGVQVGANLYLTPKIFSIYYPLGSLLSISPDSAYQGQTLWVTIKGTKTLFKTCPGAYPYFENAFGQISPNQYVYPDDTTLEAEFTIPANAALGTYNLQIKNGPWAGKDGLPQSFKVIGLTGLEEEKEMGSLIVNPNPIEPGSMLLFRLFARRDVKLEVLDLSGKLAFSLLDGPLLAGEHKIALGQLAQSLNAGLYFLKFSNGKRAVLKRILLR